MEAPHGLPRLPQALVSVVVPRLLSPSTLASVSRCPLSELHGLAEEDMLPPSPLTILGSVVHEVMQNARCPEMLHGNRVEKSIDRLFEEAIGRAEERLSNDPRTMRMVPLRRAVGKTEYHIRLARLRKWVKDLPDRVEEVPSSAMSPRTSEIPSKDHTEPLDTTSIPIGVEQPLRVSDIRLSGRPDLIETDDAGTYHVTDYKSGPIVDGEGNPREELAFQVRLYALMMEEIESSARVRLWLEGRERVEVSWSRSHKEETLERLRSISLRLPPEQTTPAVELAEAGSQCGRCRIRHRCPEYRSVAPAWWSRESTRAPVAPFDSWGEVERSESNEEIGNVAYLRDAAGREVRVSGLEVDGVHSGEGLWLFDLEPSQTLPHHGVYHHPRNFHVKAPNQSWPDAIRFRGYTDA